jgi:diphthamide synthase (EF-2-diphthine--ammonia ligase)
MPETSKSSKRDVLFWSGGKDAFLALRYLQDKSGKDPVLLTTYDDESGRVPHQNIPIETIHRQALHLGLILFTVPISYPASNSAYLQAVQSHLDQIPFSIDRLVFGDLHLTDIREWREKQFEGMGYRLLFPIWNRPFEELMNRLEEEDVAVRISSVMDDYSHLIEPGQLFNREFVDSLPDSIDKMGETGEFHTEILFGR